jgi:hypothetical protein
MQFVAARDDDGVRVFRIATRFGRLHPIPDETGRDFCVGRLGDVEVVPRLVRRAASAPADARVSVVIAGRANETNG